MRQSMMKLVVVAVVGGVVSTLPADVIPLTLAPKDFNDLGSLEAVAGWPADTTVMTVTNLRGDVTHQVFRDSGSSDYYYFYQVFNAGESSSWHIIEVLTLTPFTGADGSTTVGYLTANEPAAFVAGSVIPSGASINTASGPTISFVSPGYVDPIEVGEYGKVLYVKSALPPDTILGNIIDGAIADGLVVGPVPEPATMSLLALGGLAVLLRRRRA